MAPFMCLVTDKRKIEHVHRLIRAAYGAPRVKHVPVDNPVSLDRSNLQQLRREEYCVAYKADGVRYVLVLCLYQERPLACLVDRAGATHSLYVSAPASHFQATSVFDGELCTAIKCKRQHVFVVFNALVNQGAQLHSKPYRERLQHVKDCFSAQPVALSQRSTMQMYIFSTHARLHMMRKEHDTGRNLRSMLRNVIPLYKHDGIILTPLTRGVRPGRDEASFKHKTDNPIDVLLDLSSGEPRLQLDDGGVLVELGAALGCGVGFDTSSAAYQAFAAGMRVYEAHLGPVPHHVIEVRCQLEPGQLSLSFVRARPDKRAPNNVVTVRRTMQTIRDHVEIDDVYEALQAV